MIPGPGADFVCAGSRGPCGSVGQSPLSPDSFTTDIQLVLSVYTRGHGPAGRKGHATLASGWSSPQAYQEEVEVNSTARGSGDEGTENATSAARSALRVAIIESQPATRLGLELILGRSGVLVVLSCATLTEALAGLPGARCEVALVGSLADATPGDAVQRLRERARVEVIVITEPRHGAEGRAALRAGASGQIARDAAPATIVAALHAAASGLATMDTSVLETLLRSRDDANDLADATVGADAEESATEREAAGPARAARRVTDALSPRERELLRYLAEGYTNKEIARVMVLADDTVKKGVQSLIAKLGAADRTHAVVLALRSGLIQ